MDRRPSPTFNYTRDTFFAPVIAHNPEVVGMIEISQKLAAGIREILKKGQATERHQC